MRPPARLLNNWLLVAGVLNALAGLLHLAVILGGAEWYRFFGAGEAMARAAARGSWYPPTVTAAIAVLLFTWSGYAFSGAGLIFRLPFLRTGLVVITLIYLVRGLLLVPALLLRPDLVDAFAFWSSAIVFGYGVVHAVGFVQRWRALSNNTRSSAK